MKNEIILFENQGVRLEVNLKDETVWLNVNQIAKLFNRDSKTIRKHIKNALEEECDDSTVAKFATTTQHGAIKGKTQSNMVNYYNLDVIISVGYRVKSQNGVIFRRWATSILKNHLIKGYTINQKRLEFLEKKVQLIDIASRIDADLDSKEIKDIIKVINEYDSALDLLDEYDHRSLKVPNGTKSNDIITYKNCLDVISLLKFNNNSEIFALERNKGLLSIINNIYASFSGVEVYPTIEEKASNFLYLIIKNHVFIDGNKRIGATLFIYFLEYYNILFKKNRRVIDNNTLVALTLLIAESNPKEKQILINLIMNFLV